MAGVIVVSDEKYDELRSLLAGRATTVIMKESIAKKHGVINGDERFDDYTCGDDADVWVDFVGNDEHFALDLLK